MMMNEWWVQQGQRGSGISSSGRSDVCLCTCGGAAGGGGSLIACRSVQLAAVVSVIIFV